MPADLSSLPAPIPELLHRLRPDAATFLAQGHPEVTLARAPGRLDIIGGLADYAGSLACELSLDVAAAIALQRRDDRRLVLRNYCIDAAGKPSIDTLELSLDDFYGTAALLPDATLQQLFAGPNQWAASIAGAYPILARHKKFTRRTHGANIACYSNVPAAGGAGSTSAVAAATLTAITNAYHLILDPLETAILAQHVQHHIVGLPGGVSAAAASVLGKKDQLVLFSGHTHEHLGYLPIPAGTFFAGIHTGAAGIAAPAELKNLRASATIAVAIIAQLYKDLGFKKDPIGGCLAGVSVPLYQKYFRCMLPGSIDSAAFRNTWGPLPDRPGMLQDGITYRPRAAADYHIAENLRARGFTELLRALPTAKDASAKAAAAGALMLESHRAASDIAGLRFTAADQLIERFLEYGSGHAGEGFYGARANGGTLAVFAAESARTAVVQICTEFQAQSGIAAQLLTASSPGTADIHPLKIPVREISAAAG